jgi:dynamin 1-like protein
MQIARLEQPALQCAEMVFNELRRIVMQCRPSELRRFTGLHERVLDVANEMLRAHLSPTQNMISRYTRVYRSRDILPSTPPLVWRLT